MAVLLVMALCVGIVAPAAAARIGPISVDARFCDDAKLTVALEAYDIDIDECNCIKVPEGDIEEFDIGVEYEIHLPGTRGGKLWITLCDDYKTLNWRSNVAISAILVVDGNYPQQGGTIADLFVYDPRAYSDDGLQVTTEDGGIRQISHILFIYCDDVVVPEFPTLAVPVGLLIGMVYVASVVRGRKEE